MTLIRLGGFQEAVDASTGICAGRRIGEQEVLPRSGHPLIGSLLDAHPDAAIAHELHLLNHLRRGVAFDEVCRAAALNAWLFERGGRGYSGYDYTVPGQHQGRYRRLQILGDKKGNGTLRLLRHHPRLVDRFIDLTPIRLTLIHVIRDPFDNIATRARRKGITTRQAARGYFANADVMTRLKDRYGDLVMDVYLDDLVANPAETLGGQLRRLELETSDDHLRACANIVFDRPRRTRDDVHWEVPLVREVCERARRYPFLERFAVSEPPVHAPWSATHALLLSALPTGARERLLFPNDATYGGVRRRWRDGLFRRLYPAADAFVAVSRDVAGYLRHVVLRHAVAAPNPVQVIYSQVIAGDFAARAADFAACHGIAAYPRTLLAAAADDALGPSAP